MASKFSLVFTGTLKYYTFTGKVFQQSGQIKFKEVSKNGKNF